MQQWPILGKMSHPYPSQCGKDRVLNEVFLCAFSRTRELYRIFIVSLAWTHAIPPMVSLWPNHPPSPLSRPPWMSPCCFPLPSTTIMGNDREQYGNNLTKSWPLLSHCIFTMVEICSTFNFRVMSKKNTQHVLEAIIDSKILICNVWRKWINSMQVIVFYLSKFHIWRNHNYFIQAKKTICKVYVTFASIYFIISLGNCVHMLYKRLLEQWKPKAKYFSE